MNSIKNIFLRYLVIIIVAIPNLFIFYFLFTPLTIYPLIFLYKIFLKNVSLIGNTFIFSNFFEIEIIKACIAGSAYFFLFLLSMSISKISLKKRIYLISFSFGFLLLVNILRIFILSILFINNNFLFDISHKLFWYAGTTIFIVLIWFFSVKIFSIKEIPIYSDFKYLYNKFKNSKTSKKYKNSG